MNEQHLRLKRLKDVVCKGQIFAFIIVQTPMIREGLSKLLRDAGFGVSLAPATTEVGPVLDAARESGANLVIADGIVCERAPHLIDAVAQAAPGVPFVIITDQAGLDRIAENAIASADGILTPNLSGEEILQSLHLVKLGSKVISPHLGRPMQLKSSQLEIHYDGPPRRLDPARDALSRRETEILQHILAGCSNKAIARHLGITEATVKVHVKALLRKIRANNRTQAAIWAVNNGMDSVRPNYAVRASLRTASNANGPTSVSGTVA